MREAWEEVKGLYWLTGLLIVILALGFLGALAGDAIGLWEFDSGLGCENGDSTCS